MVPLYAFTVTKIFASKETMSAVAMYLLQWVFKVLSHNLLGLNQTDYAKG